MSDTIRTEERKLAAGDRVELYILDLAPIGVNRQLYFCDGNLNNFQPIYFQGIKYEPWGIEAKGFELNGSSLPNPTLAVRNYQSAITQTMQGLQGLIGARLTRKRTFSKFLDGQPQANPTQEYSPDIFYLGRKSQEDQDTVGWELQSIMEFRSVKIPVRQVQQNTCSHEYRGPDCGYTGPYRDKDGNLTAHASDDECSYLIKTGCKPRFGAHAVLPFGGCPGARRYT